MNFLFAFLGIIATSLGFSGVWAQSMQTYINVKRDKSFTVPAGLIFFQFWLIVGGLYLIVRSFTA